MTDVYGLPLWSRTASLESYGGHTQKRNFGGIDLVDATTDLGANHLNRLAADMAAAALVSPMLVMSVRFYEASPCIVRKAVAMWGQTVAAYDGGSPPPGFPAVTGSAVSMVLAWGDPVTDEAGVTLAVEPTIAMAGSIAGSHNSITKQTTFLYPVDGEDYLVRVW